MEEIHVKKIYIIITIEQCIFFIYIFKTKCNCVQEREKITLSCAHFLKISNFNGNFFKLQRYTQFKSKKNNFIGLFKKNIYIIIPIFFQNQFSERFGF